MGRRQISGRLPPEIRETLRGMRWEERLEDARQRRAVALANREANPAAPMQSNPWRRTQSPVEEARQAYAAELVKAEASEVLKFRKPDSDQPPLIVKPAPPSPITLPEDWVVDTLPILVLEDPVLPQMPRDPIAIGSKALVAAGVTAIVGIALMHSAPRPPAVQDVLEVSVLAPPPTEMQKPHGVWQDLATQPGVAQVSTVALSRNTEPDTTVSVLDAAVRPPTPGTKPAIASVTPRNRAAALVTTEPAPQADPANSSSSNTPVDGSDEKLVRVIVPGDVPKDMADAIVSTVETDGGVRLDDIARVGYRVSATHVRYYHAEDRAAADQIAERIHGEARDFTSAGQLPGAGYLEVYVAGDGGGIAARQASGGTNFLEAERVVTQMLNQILR